ncbi:integrin, beta [Cichlidogyrus casuarinus]|uniref:Integrin beta n=1 Tax=Cichlidogyrus casuarinus TaxID=1844966 RepID=A0ABD2QJ45_9PLAT
MDRTFLLLFLFFSLDSFHCKPSRCDTARNCQQCMGSSPECSWCFDELYNDTMSIDGPGYRCATFETLVNRGCNTEKIQMTKSSKTSEITGEYNQLQPQLIGLKMRPNDNFTIDLNFKSDENYPVDLYFLVDLSYTMKNLLETVSAMTQKINEKMSTITQDFRMGFGAFVDKPIYPFTLPSTSKNPCKHSDTNATCQPTFLYKHILSLTNDSEKFQSVTSNIKYSSNLDSPEGGFDALLQVAYCNERVGWRKEARKIVVFATDGTFHLAGDGRLAGLVKPPPNECQIELADDGSYEWKTSGLTDYPSIGEVARVLTEKSISVIFATVENLESTYEGAANFLPSARVGILSKDGSNIVNILKDSYDKIVSKMEVAIDHNQELLDVKLLMRCHDDKEFSQKSLCDKHPINGSIQYQLQVSPKKCFNGEEKVVLKLIGLEEQSVISVLSHCACPMCYNHPIVPESALCSKLGNLKCGSCECSGGYSGDFCQCSDRESKEEQRQRCINPESKLVCSKRGRCSCGKCICNDERYFGEYCQCDREQCPRATDDNNVCGGPNRGECQCDGKCKCKPGFFRSNCACRNSTLTCIAPNSDQLCSGRGSCECGYCLCDVPWTGRYCNVETTGEKKNEICKQSETCVTCLLNKHRKCEELEGFPNKNKDAGDVDYPIHQCAISSCAEECNNTLYDYKKTLISTRKDAGDESNICIFWLDSCSYFFRIKFENLLLNNEPRLFIYREIDCSDNMKILYILLGVIAAIVLGGILFMLIYKMVIEIEDKKMSAAMNKKGKDSTWGMTENPTFTSPAITVLNPLYQKS